MASKILYVCQEITPYLPETEGSRLCRALTQAMQERGNEIRTFMPRYGCINERRHQLHEVIRLSGMNLIIDDNDHQLIIKVASIPAARVQIYFIDNDDYFSRKAVLTDGAHSFLMGFGVPGADADLELPDSFTMTAHVDHADLNWMMTIATAQPVKVLTDALSDHAADAHTLVSDLTAGLNALQIA